MIEKLELSFSTTHLSAGHVEELSAAVRAIADKLNEIIPVVNRKQGGMAVDVEARKTIKTLADNIEGVHDRVKFLENFEREVRREAEQRKNEPAEAPTKG